MNEHEADKALRDLFRQEGAFPAPEGLDPRILQRIAVLPRPALAPQRALLPNWIWAIAAALMAGSAFLPGFKFEVPEFGSLPGVNWEPLFGSPWLMMGAASCVALLGLDAWLNRQRRTREAH